MNADGVTLAPATEGDVEELLRLIGALAEYEQLGDEARATSKDLRKALFAEPVRAFALLARTDGRAVGFALWFHNFSTFTGKSGIYLEDIFIEPEYRGRGIGREIFRTLARRALAEGCSRFEWAVLDRNAPAVRFYRDLGAQAMDGWTVQRVSGAVLARLAA